MSMPSFCVVSNALRLNFTKMYDASRDKKMKKIKKEEEKEMTKTMKIEGMMCPHCSGRVKTVLEGLEAVSAAEVSHETGTAVVTLVSDISNDVLAQTVEAQGYKVLSVE
jgi:Cu2+-exporting ATPase